MSKMCPQILIVVSEAATVRNTVNSTCCTNSVAGFLKNAAINTTVTDVAQNCWEHFVLLLTSVIILLEDK